jgi:hypothetical protein
MTTYILGGGLAGLVTAFYHPDYRIISPDLGGMWERKFTGPKFLHVGEEVRGLLDELGFTNLKERELQIKYWDAVERKYIEEPSREQLIEYSLRTRGILPDKATMCSVLDEPKKVFEISPDEFIRALIVRVGNQWIKDSAVRVNSEGVRGLTKKNYPFDFLINTLPQDYLHMNLIGELSQGDVLDLYAKKGRRFSYRVNSPSNEDICYWLRAKWVVRTYKEIYDGVIYEVEEIVTELGKPYDYYTLESKISVSQPFWIRHVGRSAKASHLVKLKEIILDAKKGG